MDNIASMYGLYGIFALDLCTFTIKSTKCSIDIITMEGWYDGMVALCFKLLP